jgi:hypothetical protein
MDDDPLLLTETVAAPAWPNATEPKSSDAAEKTSVPEFVELPGPWTVAPHPDWLAASPHIAANSSTTLPKLERRAAGEVVCFHRT